MLYVAYVCRDSMTRRTAWGGGTEFYYPSRGASKRTTFIAGIPMEGGGIKISGSCDRVDEILRYV